MSVESAKLSFQSVCEELRHINCVESYFYYTDEDKDNIPENCVSKSLESCFVIMLYLEFSCFVASLFLSQSSTDDHIFFCPLNHPSDVSFARFHCKRQSIGKSINIVQVFVSMSETKATSNGREGIDFRIERQEEEKVPVLTWKFEGKLIDIVRSFSVKSCRVIDMSQDNVLQEVSGSIDDAADFIQEVGQFVCRRKLGHQLVLDFVKGCHECILSCPEEDLVIFLEVNKEIPTEIRVKD